LSGSAAILRKAEYAEIPPHEALVPGTFYSAEITDSHDYDVVARILE
jgi:hypothetical protein